MQYFKFQGAVLLAATAIVSTAAPCRADFDVTYYGSTTGSRSASVEFKYVGSTLTVTLSNTASGSVHDDTDLLGAVFFNSPLLSGGKAELADALNKDGTQFNGAGLDDIGVGWAYNNTLSSTYGATSGLRGVGYGVGGSPSGNLSYYGSAGESLDGGDFVIAPSNYTSGGNSSVKNPVIVGSAVFTFSATGLTASQIGDVTFQWGTTLDAGHATGVVPVPSSFALLATLLVPGVAVLWRRRRVATASA